MGLNGGSITKMMKMTKMMMTTSEVKTPMNLAISCHHNDDDADDDNDDDNDNDADDDNDEEMYNGRTIHTVDINISKHQVQHH